MVFTGLSFNWYSKQECTSCFSHVVLSKNFLIEGVGVLYIILYVIKLHIIWYFVLSLNFRHNKHVFYRVLYILYTYIYSHIHIHITTHTDTYINTHVYTYVKLFVICFEIHHTQILHQMATSQFNSKLVSAKCKTIGQGIPKQNSVKKSTKVD